MIWVGPVYSQWSEQEGFGAEERQRGDASGGQTDAP